MIFWALHTLLVVVVLLYIVLTTVTVIGIRKPPTHSIPTWEPTVSVVTVAQNEERTLPDCLESLGTLDYPNERLEFILVNDRSSDQTEKILSDFTHSHRNAKMVSLRNVPPDRSGKGHGLAEGVLASSGELLFFTDADCRVPPQWIRTMISGYQTETGLLGGFLLLDRKGEKAPLFSKLQSMDWIYLTSVGAGWANVGRPLSVFGNNFSIRRDVYNQIGGFESIGPHLIEDFAIARKVGQKTNFRVQILLDPECAVYTHPEENAREFFLQRKRWVMGSRSHGLLGISLMGIAFFAHLLIILSGLLGHLYACVSCFFLIALSDLILFWRPLVVLKRKDLLRYCLCYELFYFVYSLFFAPFFFWGKSVTWKTSTVGTQKRNKS